MAVDQGNHYGFRLPDELVLLRDQVRRFMREEVKPIEDKLPHDAIACAPEDLARLRTIAAEMGLTRLTTPVEYGGNALSALARTVVAEESAKCRMGAYTPALGAFGGGPPVIVWSGTHKQIEKYAIPCIDGEKRAYVALTEATGGSDPRNNVRTEARRKGDVWVLNGRKMWISNAATADYGVVFARTRDGAPPQITAFIVEPHFKGIEFREIKVLRKPSPYEIVFDNCEVPTENVLGEVGGGFGVAQTWLVDARIPYAASCIGMAQEALDMACGWVKQRPARDGVLADKQAIQWMIADSEVELRAARLLTYEAAANVDAGAPGKVDASACKLLGTETAWRVVDRAIQMFGGMGLALEMPLERWYRELRLKRIGEGPSEVHRVVVARDKLRNTDGGNYFR
ncbi:MAG: acyl-CoA dehydrogenase [Gammaproteobacteria bacterium]|nr:acyl-CoA dehydrogenase [Gammaproteobacteria bacterium]